MEQTTPPSTYPKSLKEAGEANRSIKKYCQPSYECLFHVWYAGTSELMGAVDDLYRGLSSVRADLVRSCGASDLCLVEGDSLVAECLSESSLDCQHGGQFLHLTYLVEKYLQVAPIPFHSIPMGSLLIMSEEQGLKNKGAAFRILFIDENRAVWHEQESKLLARELVYRHLKLNTEFKVDRIRSWLDEGHDQVQKRKDLANVFVLPLGLAHVTPSPTDIA